MSGIRSLAGKYSTAVEIYFPIHSLPEAPTARQRSQLCQCRMSRKIRQCGDKYARENRTTCAMAVGQACRWMPV